MQKNIETNNELPSMAKLIKSTILAIFIAAIILITVVLPAEYGIDPTGVGSMIGLVKMGEIKASLAQEVEAEKSAQKTETAESSVVVKESPKPEEKEIAKETTQILNVDKISLTLKPNEGKEIKLTMVKDAKVKFVWYTDGGKANFDAHADSKPLKISYHNYEKGSMERNEGVMDAAFDGNHGWFWRNRTSEPMTVTLEVEGDYTDVIRY